MRWTLIIMAQCCFCHSDESLWCLSLKLNLNGSITPCRCRDISTLQRGWWANVCRLQMIADGPTGTPPKSQLRIVWRCLSCMLIGCSNFLLGSFVVWAPVSQNVNFPEVSLQQLCNPLWTYKSTDMQWHRSQITDLVGSQVIETWNRNKRQKIDWQWGLQIFRKFSSSSGIGEYHFILAVRKGFKKWWLQHLDILSVASEVVFSLFRPVWKNW